MDSGAARARGSPEVLSTGLDACGSMVFEDSQRTFPSFNFLES
jgi:hypothetical protein